MTINELIARLEELREITGDCQVEVPNPAGDFDIASEAHQVNISREKGKMKYRVYIET